MQRIIHRGAYHVKAGSNVINGGRNGAECRHKAVGIHANNQHHHSKNYHINNRIITRASLNIRVNRFSVDNNRKLSVWINASSNFLNKRFYIQYKIVNGEAVITEEIQS